MKKFLLSVIALCCLSFGTQAAERISEAKFNQLLADNQAVLVDIKADWCPTCAKQAKILKAYFADNPASKITLLEVDFDKQKKWVKYFKAPRQSTLLLFKGKEVLWFSVAETRRDVIFQELAKAEAL
ncbi:thioredoxin family protein [Neiella marina]|uniref:Thioredoxin family protein n=1 Tax=Neiella holothuriorum TaxID=2870530 RepID=A0ABS7EJT4_9GAMM|nr:thioredoxin family protein [Neiella holothuriorum]MBW8192128.1 thioredoxin family protein [Neiella holothuriorum]